MEDGWIHACGVRFWGMEGVYQGISFMSFLGTLATIAGLGALAFTGWLMRGPKDVLDYFFALIMAVLGFGILGAAYFAFAEMSCYLGI